MRILSFVIITMLLSIRANAQIRLHSYLEQYDTLFILNNGKDLVSVQQFFPAYDVYEKDLTSAFQIKLKKRLDSVKWASIPVNKLRADFDQQLTVSIRSYLENVSSFNLVLYDWSSKQWKSYVTTPKTDGLQTPVHLVIAEWSLLPEKVSFENKDRLYILCEPKDAKKEMIVQFGSFMIGKYYWGRKPISLDFFTGIIDEYSDSVLANHKKVFLNEFLLPSKYDYLNTPSNLHLVSEDEENGEPSLVYAVLERTFQNYRFYHEANIDQNLVLSEFRKSFKERMHSSDSLTCDMINDLSQFVENKFSDPHFGVKSGSCPAAVKRPNSKGPIRLYEIDHKILVAAILNSEYEDDLSLGMEIETIDGYQVNTIVDSLSKFLGPWERRKDVVSDLLLRGKDDSVMLGIKGLASPVKIKYNAPISIPDNFRYKHCEYKDINKSTAYFRVKSWTLDVYFEFNRYWEATKDKEYLILDLRSNSGGEFLSALRLMTIFLNKPLNYFRTKKYHDQYESFIVNPNPNISFRQESKVLILVDSKTACTSESFILGMRRLPNVTIIGQDKTYGTDASRNDITFPSGFQIYINAIAQKNVYPDAGIIETDGIEPDIWIYPSQVLDLRPYNDKVLQSTLELIKAKNF